MDLKKFMLEGNPVCRKEAVIVAIISGLQC